LRVKLLPATMVTKLEMNCTTFVQMMRVVMRIRVFFLKMLDGATSKMRRRDDLSRVAAPAAAEEGEGNAAAASAAAPVVVRDDNPGTEVNAGSGVSSTVVGISDISTLQTRVMDKSRKIAELCKTTFFYTIYIFRLLS